LCEPQIVKKYQTTISDEIEEKIISMYGLGDELQGYYNKKD